MAKEQRLIDADKLKWRMGIDSNDRQIFFVTNKDIDEQHTIEATPVVHGRWEESNYHGFLCCSECKDVYIDKTWFGGGKWNYCPNCGAKMDGGVSDG